MLKYLTKRLGEKGFTYSVKLILMFYVCTRILRLVKINSRIQQQEHFTFRSTYKRLKSIEIYDWSKS